MAHSECKPIYIGQRSFYSSMLVQLAIYGLDFEKKSSELGVDGGVDVAHV